MEDDSGSGEVGRTRDHDRSVYRNHLHRCRNGHSVSQTQIGESMPVVAGWEVVKYLKELDRIKKQPQREGLLSSILRVLGLLRKAA